MYCRLCGRSAQDISGWLERVNEKGVPGIWECRPCCDDDLFSDEDIIAMLNDEA